MTFSSPQWTEEGMMKVPTDHILPAEPPRDRNLWRSWKLSLSCVLRTYVGSLTPPLSLLPKQGGSSLLTHCPDHPPSAPRWQLLTQRQSRGLGHALPPLLPVSVSQCLVSCCDIPPLACTWGLYPVTQTLHNWLHYTTIQHSLSWLSTTFPQSAK